MSKIQTVYGVEEVQPISKLQVDNLEIFTHKASDGYTATLKFNGVRLTPAFKSEKMAVIAAKNRVSDLGLRKIATISSQHPYFDRGGRLVSHLRMPETAILEFYARIVNTMAPHVASTVEVDALRISGVQKLHHTDLLGKIHKLFSEWNFQINVTPNRYAPRMSDFFITIESENQ